MISFPKPIVAAVNGPAVGIGVAILPLCDIVYASDKASFYVPYARLAQTPEGCASFTFPQVMGMAMVSGFFFYLVKITVINELLYNVMVIVVCKNLMAHNQQVCMV